MFYKNKVQAIERTAIVTQYGEITYGMMLEQVRHFACYTPDMQGAKTLILAENSVEWIYSFFSIWQNRGIAIPVDAGSSADDVAYILDDARPDAIWVNAQTEPVVRRAMEQSGVHTEILRMDALECSSVNPHAVTVEMGISFDDTDVAVILYTSGTTGFPKGVMLTFKNLLVNIDAISGNGVPIFCQDSSTLILLPLHHIFSLAGTLIAPIFCESQVVLCPAMTGPEIMASLQRGRVTIMLGVPRLWQTLFYGIKKKIDASLIGRFMFALCKRIGSRWLSRMVFSAVHRQMGGHLVYCVSGGAALDTEIGEGLRTLGISVLEGYGMTETSPMISFTRPDDIIPGCSGLPLPCCECKIIDGEICVKGDNVMKGYYNRPQETAALFDENGYLHTGDLARLDEKGRVYITGRKKEIIVLSNGKNVQPVEIEFKIEKFDRYVKECAVSYHHDKLVAVIVPQADIAKGRTDAELEALLKHEVLEPYNNEALNYKKVMSLFILHTPLPRTRLSKIQRFRVLEMLQSGVGHTEVAASVSTDELQTPEFRILREYIQREKRLGVVRQTDHLETDLGLDSLDRVSMQEFIEQTFGTEVNADAILSFSTLQSLAEHIAAQKTRTEVVEDVDWHNLLTGTEAVLPSRPTILLPLCAGVMEMINRLYFRLSVKGRKNIPAYGPFILAPNHQSFLDGPIVTSGLSWKMLEDCYFYATEEHVRSRLRKYMARRCNIILMQRSNLKTSIQNMAQVLRAGKSLVIFPEGRRTNTGELGMFKKTFAILARELQVPIVPVRITGAFEAWPRHSSVPCPRKIVVEYLPAFLPDASMSYDDIAERVKRQISGE
ncbi:MAG: AMP-binding protein [Paraprevotella sp.]|nr:AMP-binding protein [Paraprevotella sp.]